MLQIMLCGAHDTGELTDAFTQVAQDFGADPWFYQLGRVHHINSRTSRWSENSRATVRKADICVFVILDRYGDITWTHELQEALDLGKPFAVLALESAWVRYTHLLHNIADSDAIISKDDRQMVELLRMISSDYQLTVTPFTYTTFKEKVRSELSGLMLAGLRLLETRNRRSTLMEALIGDTTLSREQINQLVLLAVDEYEANKLERKTALRRLASEGFRDNEFVVDVSRSAEQGVQRLAFDLLPHLLVLPPNEDVLRELAQVAGRSDDVGIARRYIGSIIEIDATMLDVVLEATGSVEEGVRRRAFEGVEENWDHVLSTWGSQRMLEFLRMCEAKTSRRVSWIERLRTMKDDLG